MSSEQDRAPPGHTPAPWKLGEIKGGYINIDAVGRQKHEALARVVWNMEGEERSPQQEGNARLIAAAPELLTTLEDLLSNFPDENPFPHETHGTILFKWSDLFAARAVLAKATGAP